MAASVFYDVAQSRTFIHDTIEVSEAMLPSNVLVARLSKVDRVDVTHIFRTVLLALRM